MNKSYPITSSPLYRLRNHRKLEKLLKLPEGELKKKTEYRYNSFSIMKSHGTEQRTICSPENRLKNIQSRIQLLLSRIETPSWVMTGKKNCSYISNAEWHINQVNIRTMDISQFYCSITRGQIYDMFVETFRMANDIAWIMTNLVSHDGTLPMGSPASQIIAYWVFSQMFEEVNRIALSYECSFTLYVDDMTFSSEKPITRAFRNQIANILRKNGLEAKIQKDHYYQGSNIKEVTGVGIRNGKKVVLNHHRKKVLDLFEKCKKKENIHDIESLQGLLCSLRQIEPDIFPEVARYLKRYEEAIKTIKQKSKKRWESRNYKKPSVNC